MRIYTRPFQTVLATGEVTAHRVMVVGHLPHRTAYIEESAGVTTDPAQAGAVVGEYIQADLFTHEFARLAERHGHDAAQEMAEKGEISIRVPSIPGVTCEGTWVNPRFGDRARHGIKA